MMNGSLFEWVLENLSKNAADAIGTERGSITIRLIDMPDRAAIEVQDTGKGIKKKICVMCSAPASLRRSADGVLGSASPDA